MLRGALVHFDLRFRKDKIDMVGTVVHVCILTSVGTFGACLVTWSS
jgi:hypothetical protein